MSQPILAIGSWGVAVLVGMLLMALVALELRASRRRALRITSTRDELDFDEWLKLSQLEALSNEQRQLVREALIIAGDCYVVPPTCLRMKDGFWDELGMHSWFSNGDDAYDTLGDRLADELNIRWDINWATLGDVVRGVIGHSRIDELEGAAQ
ncbi:hypothetical protein NG895_25375 [Aeoliella sp. ICT_H6.2]|uniref:Uncharacterized protein n=1 Tax=Aeoliella straminimaris TaxID=2954799 RepID=A0A9X2JIM3_9BACT|nr:hypothetical protein [Aeoliella straminimaris]MCO6047245.1 hypothetical protein [Aeoliella straminimaris]